MQLIESIEVSQEKSASVLDRDGGAIKKNVFAFPVIRPQPNQVPFIGRDVSQLVLPVKAGDHRVALPYGFAGLDGKGNGDGVSEVETDNRMRDPWRSPISDGEVN